MRNIVDILFPIHKPANERRQNTPLYRIFTIFRRGAESTGARLHPAWSNEGNCQFLLRMYKREYFPGNKEETTAGLNKKGKGRTGGPIRVQATMNAEYVMQAAWEAFETTTYYDNYLSNRQLVYNTRMKRITTGAAQEYILGPDLYSINYDGILRRDMPEGTFWLDTQMTLQLLSPPGIRKRQKSKNSDVSCWEQKHGWIPSS